MNINPGHYNHVALQGRENVVYIIYLVLTYCLLSLLACRAATKDLHSCLFWAFLRMVPHVYPISFISASTILPQAFFWSTLFFLPRWGPVQFYSCVAILIPSVDMPCPLLSPSHYNHTVAPMHSCLLYIYSIVLHLKIFWPNIISNYLYYSL